MAGEPLWRLLGCQNGVLQSPCLINHGPADLDDSRRHDDYEEHRKKEQYHRYG
jgi:hypothetical protein